jgi:hypothetical protein
MSARIEERHDRDLIEGIVPGQDMHDESLRKLREHLRRPITAGEASGEVRLNGNALRRHADLDRIKEHPYVRLVREYRDARESE